MKKMKLILSMQKLALLLLLPALACASKKKTVEASNSNSDIVVVSEVVESSKLNEIEPIAVLQEDPKNRPVECLHPFGENPDDSLEMRRTISLYQDEIEAKNYVAAYPLWQKIIEKAPCARVGPYFDAEVMFPQLFAHPDFKDRKNILMDSFFMSYSLRIKFHGGEGAAKGRWAYWLNYYRPQQFNEIIALCERAIELEKNNVEYIVPSTYVNAVLLGFKNKKIEKEKVFDAFDRVSGIMEFNANAGGQYADYWKKIQTDVEESIKNFLTCDDIDEILYPRLKSNPDDIQLKEKLVKFYRNSRCIENPNYIKVLNSLFQQRPDASTAEELAKFYDSKGDIKNANLYYEKAAEMSEDPKKQEFFYVKIASNNLNNKNNGVAITYANKAIGANANSGNAYIILAVAKFNNAQSACDGINKKAAAWIAIDLLQKAASIDPSVKESAQSKISSYQNIAPSKEEAFFHGITEGQTYNVECMGQSTTVRFYK
jgi:hypothetical protein